MESETLYGSQVLRAACAKPRSPLSKRSVSCTPNLPGVLLKLSEFEHQRLRNIARNQELLRQLGLA